MSKKNIRSNSPIKTKKELNLDDLIPSYINDGVLMDDIDYKSNNRPTQNDNSMMDSYITDMDIIFDLKEERRQKLNNHTDLH